MAEYLVAASARGAEPVRAAGCAGEHRDLRDIAYKEFSKTISDDFADVGERKEKGRSTAPHGLWCTAGVTRR